MAVPTTVADLDLVAANNSPAGSDAVGTIDDYIRAHASIIKQVSQAAAPDSTKLAGVTPTAAGLALLDDADASAQRTTLGLGSAATKTAGSAANNVMLIDANGNAGLPLDQVFYGFTTDYGFRAASGVGLQIHTGAADQIVFGKRNGASFTETYRIGSAGQFGIGGATYGTAGQVLTSGGPSAAPTWSAASGGLGVGQTWQSVTRTQGTTYTNGTGKPIMLRVFGVVAFPNQYFIFTVGGLAMNWHGGSGQSSTYSAAEIIIPVGANYSWDISAGGSISSVDCVELR